MYVKFIFTYSISDERLKSLKFASVYGIIKDILYFESWKTMNCLWCDENPSEEFHIQNLKKENDLEPEYKCSKPFSELNNSTEINKIWFPETYFNISEEKKNGFGIRGNYFQFIYNFIHFTRLSLPVYCRW